MSYYRGILRDDDGLRLLAKTFIGDEPVVTFHNPSLIAQLIALRRQRQEIKEANQRQFG